MTVRKLVVAACATLTLAAPLAATAPAHAVGGPVTVKNGVYSAPNQNLGRLVAGALGREFGSAKAARAALVSEISDLPRTQRLLFAVGKVRGSSLTIRHAADFACAIFTRG